MTEPQNILTETLDRMVEQFAQSTASEIQLGLQQAIDHWGRLSTGGSVSIGTLSPLASIPALPASGEQRATGAQAVQVGKNRLLTALQDQLAALQGHASFSTATRRAQDATTDGAASLAPASNFAAETISHSLSQSGSSETIGELRRPVVSLGASRHDPPSLQIPSETSQRMTQSVNRLLTDNPSVGFASTSQLPDPAAPVSAGRLETLVAQAQQASADSPGSGVDTISSRTLDRLRDAALRQLNAGESLVPFQSGLAVDASRRPVEDRAAQSIGTAERNQSDLSGSRQRSSDGDPIDAQPVADQRPSAPPQSLPPAATPDPHQSAWATIQSQKADARWNNQPTDVLKPLR